MRVLRERTAAIVIVSLAALTLPARADDRAGLRACQAMVDRAAQPGQATASGNTGHDDAELRRCRQVIHEWTLRDARMSVDEQGQPLR
jgi:hypothetical protein